MSLVSRHLLIFFLSHGADRCATDIEGHENKVKAFNSLVHRLPRPNMALLQTLVQFLTTVVKNSSVNKMTMKNVGIVFVPTLNIPAPVFSMFMTDYDGIFEKELVANDAAADKEAGQRPTSWKSPDQGKHPDSPSHDIQNTIAGHHAAAAAAVERDSPVPQEVESGTKRQPPNNYGRHSVYRVGKAEDAWVGSRVQFVPMNRSLGLGANLGDGGLSKAAKRESSLLFMDQSQANPWVSSVPSDPGGRELDNLQQAATSDANGYVFLALRGDLP